MQNRILITAATRAKLTCTAETSFSNELAVRALMEADGWLLIRRYPRPNANPPTVKLTFEVLRDDDQAKEEKTHD